MRRWKIEWNKWRILLCLLLSVFQTLQARQKSIERIEKRTILRRLIAFRSWSGLIMIRLLS